jgi:hypothetical protein
MMRSVYYQIAKNLKTGREKAIEGDKNGAIQAFDLCLGELRLLPPEHTRDVLFAHAYLNKYQTLALENKDSKRAVESLNRGVAYARSCKDPMARAIAEECLSGLDLRQ